MMSRRLTDVEEAGGGGRAARVAVGGSGWVQWAVGGGRGVVQI
jgi:hypothetical protein